MQCQVCFSFYIIMGYVLFCMRLQRIQVAFDQTLVKCYFEKSTRLNGINTMLKLSFIIILCAWIWSPTKAIANEVVMSVICFDCNESYAKNLAKEHATPFIECDQNNDYFEFNSTQSCYSQPKKIIVFDGLYKTAYPYRLSHSNQGGPLNTLRLNIDDFQIESGTHSLLTDIANARLDYEERMETFVADTLSRIPNEEFNNLVLSSSVNDQCSDDPGVAAFKRAMSQSDTTALKTWFQIQQNVINDSVFGFLPFDISALSFSYQSPPTPYGSLGITGQFDVDPDASVITVVYTNISSTLRSTVVEGAQIESSAVVYKIGKQENFPSLVEVNVEPDLSRVDGVPLSDIAGGRVADVDQTKPVSKCVYDYIKDVYETEQRMATVGGGLGGSTVGNRGGSGSGEMGPALTYEGSCVVDTFSGGEHTGTFKINCADL